LKPDLRLHVWAAGVRSFNLLRVAAEAELLRLRAMLVRQGRRAAFGAVAVIFVLGVLILGEVAGWQVLHLYVAPISATLILLGINLAIAAVFGGRIRDALADLVEGLDEHPDADPGASETENDVAGATGAEQRLPKHPAPDLPLPVEDARPLEWRSPHPVICIGGRGPFDGDVAEMFAQLLRFGARVISCDSVSRAQIAALDTRGVALVFIGYLEMAGAPAELRYVIRRIRSRLPRTTIVIGLWPEGDPFLVDQDRQKAAGADHYVTSLRDAVTACLETVRQASIGEPPLTEEAHFPS
jgi:hypothetical protein